MTTRIIFTGRHALPDPQVLIIPLVVALATTNENGESTSDWTGGLYILVWFGSIGLAVAFNRDYLRKLATKQVTNEARFHQPHSGIAPLHPPVGTSWPPRPPVFTAGANIPAPLTDPQGAIQGLADTGSYYAPRPPVGGIPNTAHPLHEQGRPSVPGTAAPAAPVDINTATASQLAEYTGLDGVLCEGIVAGRDRVGGFGSLDEIATATGLQPHHLARLRNVTYGPRSTMPRAPRTGGRVLDF